MVLHCAGPLKPQIESGPVTADLTTTVVYNYKAINHSLWTSVYLLMAEEFY